MSHESNAKDELISAIQQHISLHGKEPTKATISRELALDFCKLGRNELGSLSQELFEKGIEALNGRRVIGITITVAGLNDDVDYIELE